MSLVTITVTTRRGEDSCFDLSVEWDWDGDGTGRRMEGGLSTVDLL
jgi:hypothetical protein